MLDFVHSADNLRLEEIPALQSFCFIGWLVVVLSKPSIFFLNDRKTGTSVCLKIPVQVLLRVMSKSTGEGRDTGPNFYFTPVSCLASYSYIQNS